MREMRLEKRRQHNRINEDAAIQQISCRCKENGFMLRILLCDDDARMLDKIHSKVRETMDALGEKVSISKYTNADMVGTAALAAADLALLDVDLEKKDYNGVDLARRLRAACAAIDLPGWHTCQPGNFSPLTQIIREIRRFFLQTAEK